jgi:hypothetical protein
MRKAKTSGSVIQWINAMGMRLNMLLYKDDVWHDAAFEVELGNVSLAYGFADKAYVHYRRALEHYGELRTLAGRYLPKRIARQEQEVANRLAEIKERMIRRKKLQEDWENRIFNFGKDETQGTLFQ